ncbi:MAG: LamG-like jellyroll fold domain-containing protein [Opitutales bacterium]
MNEDVDIIARALEGGLDAAEAAEFLRRLDADPALRESFGRQASLHGMLGPAMEDEVTHERRVARITGAVRQVDDARFEDDVRRRIRRVVCRRRLIQAAAAVVIFVTVLFAWMRLPDPVATVARVQSFTGETELVVGAKLTRGTDLQIDSGLVELELLGRGRMIVEGPAKLAFTSSDSVVLHQGRVHLRVTPAGHGYRIDTPQGTVVDLGTEFGMLVDEATGEVETHVLKGEVKAIPRDGGQAIFLRDDEALRQAGGQSLRMPADHGSFYGSLPPEHRKTPGMVRWSMDAGEGSSMRATTRGLEEGPHGLRFFAKGQEISPPTVDGPFGKAVRFDGVATYGESGFKGIGGNAPRTVAFWVKVPADFQSRQGFAMVSWGEWSPDNFGGVWQISVNPLDQDGPVGRLRIGVHGGMAIGSTDLRDDHWHHVAVVLYPAANPDFGKHVLLYINGEVEPVSRRTLGVIDTSTEEASHGVWLGRNINAGRSHGGFFRGAFDEVYIFDAALSQKEIRALIERNEPPG